MKTPIGQLSPCCQARIVVKYSGGLSLGAFCTQCLKPVPMAALFWDKDHGAPNIGQGGGPGSRWADLEALVASLSYNVDHADHVHANLANLRSQADNVQKIKLLLVEIQTVVTQIQEGMIEFNKKVCGDHSDWNDLVAKVHHLASLISDRSDRSTVPGDQVS